MTMQPCDECGGSGCSFGNHRTAHTSDDVMCAKYPCRSCLGVGRVPTETVVDVLAEPEETP